LKTQQKKHSKPKRADADSRIFAPEARKALIDKIRDLIEPLCSTEGMELVHVEFQREAGGRILRLYIDKPGGVTLDDCAYISRQAGDLIDVHLEDEFAYSLEVSSPGPERPLGKAEDFNRFKGHEARLKTARPVDGQKNFKGTLLGISEGIVKLSVGEKTVDISIEQIVKARLVNHNPF